MSSAPEPASSTASSSASGSDAGRGLEEHRGSGGGLAAERPVRRPSRRPTGRPRGTGVSNRPSSNLTRRIRATASSMRAWSIVPAASPARTASAKRGPSLGTMTMSMPAMIERATAVGVVGVDLVDARPVGHDEAAEPELALEDVGQQVAVAVDLAGARCSRTRPSRCARRRRWPPDRARGGSRRRSPRRRRSRPGRWGSRWSSTSPTPCRRRRRSAWPCRGRRSGRRRGPAARGGRPHRAWTRPTDPRGSPRTSDPSARPAGRPRPARSPSGMPVASISSAVAAPIRSTRSGSRDGPEPDLVREDRRADDVVVAVDRVDAVQDRDAQAGRQGRGLEALDHAPPAGRVVLERRTATAAQHRAEELVGDALPDRPSPARAGSSGRSSRRSSSRRGGPRLAPRAAGSDRASRRVRSRAGRDGAVRSVRPWSRSQRPPRDEQGGEAGRSVAHRRDGDGSRASLPDGMGGRIAPRTDDRACDTGGHRELW